MRTRPLTRADLPSCADLAARAFINDDLYAWLSHAHAHPADFRAYQLRRLRARFVQPAVFGFVCVSDEDEEEGDQGEEVVLGYAFWARMGAKDATAAGAGAATAISDWWRRRNAGLAAWVERGLLEVEERYVAFFGLDGSYDPEVRKVFATAVASRYFDALGDYWYLCALGVEPERQRKGVGSLLLRWGLERAREEGVPVSLIGSDEGRRLYAKYGFKVVDWTGLAVENEWVSGAVMVLDEERRWVRDVGEGERVGRGGRAVEVAWIGAGIEVPTEEEKVGTVAEQ